MHCNTHTHTRAHTYQALWRPSDDAQALTPNSNLQFSGTVDLKIEKYTVFLSAVVLAVKMFLAVLFLPIYTISPRKRKHARTDRQEYCADDRTGCTVNTDSVLLRC